MAARAAARRERREREERQQAEKQRQDRELAEKLRQDEERKQRDEERKRQEEDRKEQKEEAEEREQWAQEQRVHHEAKQRHERHAKQPWLAAWTTYEGTCIYLTDPETRPFYITDLQVETVDFWPTRVGSYSSCNEAAVREFFANGPWALDRKQMLTSKALASGSLHEILQALKRPRGSSKEGDYSVAGHQQYHRDLLDLGSWTVRSVRETTNRGKPWTVDRYMTQIPTAVCSHTGGGGKAEL
jgi:phage-related minor tail protein